MKYELNEKALRTAFTSQNWRARKGWLNQADKAALIGLSQAQVSKLERAEKSFKDLKLGTYLAICEGMGYAPFEFFEYEFTERGMK